MSIFIHKESRVVVQGVTGKEGAFWAKHMKDMGTQVVFGVTPGKEGQDVDGIPVYHSVRRGIKDHPADVAMLFVPTATSSACGTLLRICSVSAAPILPPCPSITSIFISLCLQSLNFRYGSSTTPETGSSPYISTVQSTATPPTVTGSPAA